MTSEDIGRNLVNDLVLSHQTYQLLPADKEYSGIDNAKLAYRVQDEVAAELNQLPVTAWKLGASSTSAEPYCAPIYHEKMHQSPARIPSELFHGMGMEAELCFVFNKSLPAKPEAYNLDEVLAAVGTVEVAMELVDSRFKEWQQRDHFLKLADNQMNGALIIGTGIPADFSILNFTDLQGELWVNDFLVAAGPHVIEQPVAALPWLANHLAARQGGWLREGDRVITGSWTGMTFVFPGDCVRANFHGIGEAGLTLL